MSIYCTVSEIQQNIGRNHLYELTLPLFSVLLGVTPLEFCRDLWQQRTRLLGLSYGDVYVIPHLAVLVQYQRVMDEETDRHTMTAYTALA